MGDSGDNTTLMWGKWSAPRVHSVCTLSVRNSDACMYTWTKQVVTTAWIRHNNDYCALGSSPGSMHGPSPTTAMRGMEGIGYPPSLPACSKLLPFAFHPAGMAISVTPPFFFQSLLLYHKTGGANNPSFVHHCWP